MNHRPLLPLCLAAVLALGGCGGSEQSLADDVEAGAGAAAEAGSESDEEAPAAEPEPEPWEVAPLSDAPLGEFPYFAIPAGYHTTDRLSSTVSLGRFPFWTGEHYIEVEGRIHQANLRADEGKTFSAIEIAQGIDQAITRAGGIKVADMAIPRGRSAEVLTRAFTQEFSNGLCWPSEPVRTYIVRRTDRDIWVHTCTYGGSGAAWVIAEARAPAPEAQPISADALAGALEADGRVALPIGFASAAAALLPGAGRQIQEIAALMQQRPEWRLDVAAHAGHGGGEALAIARAQAVVELLRKAGVESGRLSAVGSGDAAEMAAGASMIELVRQPDRADDPQNTPR